MKTKLFTISKHLVMQAMIDKEVIACRHQLADVVANAFISSGKEIDCFELLACVEKEGIDKNYVEEETCAISLLMNIAGDITKSANMLYLTRNPYSVSALIRQLVEVEYLVWAFESDSAEARKWINSSKEERMNFFTPAKLRKTAGDRFRRKDYGYHCELGGHPVPGAEKLLDKESNLGQILLSDMLSHTWRIWDHLVKWAMKSYDNHHRKRITKFNFAIKGDSRCEAAILHVYLNGKDEDIAAH